MATYRQGIVTNDVSPAEAFRLDLRYIDACDALVAFVGSRVSAGIQFELGYAVAGNKRIVLVSPASDLLTYINQGLVDSGKAQLVQYASWDDLLSELRNGLLSLTA